MAGKRNLKVVVGVLLAVVAGGICFTTCKPEEPNFSISFVGFTNGSEGQLQAVFDITNHVRLRPDWMYAYAVGYRDEVSSGNYEWEEGIPFSFRPHVTAEVLEIGHSFRMELLVKSLRLSGRLWNSRIIRDTVISKWIPPPTWDGLSSHEFSSPWIRNPYATNQAQPKPPE